MKKIFYFIVCILWLVGLIGGVGYTIYYSLYPIAVGVATNGIIAFPKVKDMFGRLTS